MVGVWLVSSCAVIVLVQLMISSFHTKQKSCGTLLVAGGWFAVGQSLSSDCVGAVDVVGVVDD